MVERLSGGLVLVLVGLYGRSLGDCVARGWEGPFLNAYANAYWATLVIALVAALFIFIEDDEL